MASLSSEQRAATLLDYARAFVAKNGRPYRVTEVAFWPGNFMAGREESARAAGIEVR